MSILPAEARSTQVKPVHVYGQHNHVSGLEFLFPRSTQKQYKKPQNMCASSLLQHDGEAHGDSLHMSQHVPDLPLPIVNPQEESPWDESLFDVFPAQEVPFTFDDVAVYFSKEEWKLLKEQQKEMYRTIMKEHYEMLSSLGFVTWKPDIISRIEKGEEPYFMDSANKEMRFKWEEPSRCSRHEEENMERGKPCARCHKTTNKKKFTNGKTSPANKHQVSGKTKKIPECKAPSVQHQWNPRNKEAVVEIEMLPVKYLQALNRDEKAVQLEMPSAKERQVHNKQKAIEEKMSPAREGQGFENREKILERALAAVGEDQASSDRRKVTEGEKPPIRGPQGFKRRKKIGSSSAGKWLKRKYRKNWAEIDLRKTLPRKSKEKILCYLDEDENGKQCNQSEKKPRTPPEDGLVEASDCERSVGTSNDSIKQKTSRREKTHICTECRKRFVTRSTLAHHMKTHTGARPYTCTQCHKSFRQSSHLVSHQSVHTGLKPFECNVCFRKFSKKVTLINHKRTHTGEKPYMCNVCGKPFSRSEALNVHKRIHTGERPYHCFDCGKSFSHSATLVAHQRKHTGERPYPCSVCGKCFSRYETVIAHKRIHTGEKPYKCSECGKSFTQSETLVIHQRTHTGVKPYTCEECGKNFRHASSVVAHKRIHTGERPFICSICGNTFNHAASLRLHKKLHARQTGIHVVNVGRVLMTDQS